MYLCMYVRVCVCVHFMYVCVLILLYWSHILEPETVLKTLIWFGCFPWDHSFPVTLSFHWIPLKNTIYS